MGFLSFPSFTRPAFTRPTRRAGDIDIHAGQGRGVVGGQEQHRARAISSVVILRLIGFAAAATPDPITLLPLRAPNKTLS